MTRSEQMQNRLCCMLLQRLLYLAEWEENPLFCEAYLDMICLLKKWWRA